jgi:hypothetical protein
MADPFILLFFLVGLIALGAFAEVVFLKSFPKSAKLFTWIAVIAAVIASLMGMFLAIVIAISVAYG